MTKFIASRPDGQARAALVSCRLTSAGQDCLNIAAKSLGISRAQLMRQAIAAYVEALPNYNEIKRQATLFVSSRKERP